MTEQETVLLYNIPSGSLECLRVRSALSEMPINLKEVRPEDMARNLGELADPVVPGGESIPSQSAAPGPEDFSESVLIFCGFNQDRLKLALSHLKEAGANPSCLKAVMTPTNRDWRFCDLVKELVREREAFLQMRRGRINRDVESTAVPGDGSS